MADKTNKLRGNSSFQPADFTIPRFAAHVEAGTTLEDVKGREFFANFLPRLKPGMRVDVISKDMELDCEIRILTVEKTYATIRVLAVYSEPKEGKKTAEAEKDDGEYKVSHAPAHGWRFGRAKEEPVEKGFGSRKEAEDAMTAYLDKMNKAS